MDKDLIEELIHCKKFIIQKPKKNDYPDKQDKYILRNDFKCESEDKKYKFDVFMRRHTDLASQFSIGLVLIDKNEKNSKINLVRCNGKHSHKNKVIDNKFFNDFHMHIANDKQPERTKSFDAVEVEYLSYSSALVFFCNFCNIQDDEDVLKIKEVRNNINMDELFKKGGLKND